jgi:predicted chitinase
MPDKVLPYNPSIVPQEKYWDCGPASAQIALNSRGIDMSEDELIRRIGTDEDGTDFVGLVENVLDDLLPDANYTSVYIENDPPTSAQITKLGRDIQRSIDAGYVIVANIVSPPGNHPQAVKGTRSPGYSGTIWHYLTVVGYDDAGNVKLADPGFAPFEYWITLAQLSTLIPPKGYCFADIDSTGTSTAPPAQPSGPDPADVLYRAVPIIDRPTAGALVARIVVGLALAQCNTPKRIAMWLAQIGLESDGFQATEEYQKDGPGWTDDRRTYLGRTWIQITWRSNYLGFSQWAHAQGLVPTDTYFVDNPGELADAKWAAIGPAWYWTVERPQINDLCDASDLIGVTRAINGGTNGLEDETGQLGRRTRYNQALALGDELLALTATTRDEDEMAGWTTELVQRAMVLMENQTGVMRPSTSPFRRPHEGNVNTCGGFAWASDGMIHAGFVEHFAVTYGDPASIAMLWATQETDEPGREMDKELAAKVLLRVPDEFIKAAQPVIQSWLDAEAAAKAGA